MSNQHPAEQSESMEPAPQPSLCSNNCGFFSNPSCNGMCSICYRDFAQKHAKKDEGAAAKKSPVNTSLVSQSPQPSKSPPSPLLSTPAPHAALQTLVTDCKVIDTGRESGSADLGGASPATDLGSVAPRPGRRRAVRCFVCSKKIGLMGFKCRCEQHFCEKHRYPEAHECPFDHKAAERQRIQEENPVIRTERVKKV